MKAIINFVLGMLTFLILISVPYLLPVLVIAFIIFNAVTGKSFGVTNDEPGGDI